MSRTYTQDLSGVGEGLRFYKGFNRDILDAPFVAVVVVQGEKEVWFLDDLDQAKQQFQKFLEDNSDEYGGCIVTYYKHYED